MARVQRGIARDQRGITRIREYKGVLPLVLFQGVVVSFHTDDDADGESNDMSIDAAVMVEVVVVAIGSGI